MYTKILIRYNIIRMYKKIIIFIMYTKKPNSTWVDNIYLLLNVYLYTYT